MSILQLIKRTIPFFISRIIVYLIFGAISLIFLGLMLGLGILLFRWFEFASGFFIFLMIITFFGVLGLLRFIERYFLYMVKVGHIAVVTELLRKGSVPDGKSQISYGKDQVVNNFGSANVAFVVDKIIYGAVKQIQRWLMRIGNFLNFIPGAKNIIGILSKVMAVSLRYVDEAILSYIMLRKSEAKDAESENEESVWKNACDGVVLYAQSWKKIIITAAGIVAFVYILNIAVFLITVFPLMALASTITDNAGAAGILGYFAIIGAYIITSMVKRAFVDPIAMIAMVRTYQLNIEDMEPSIDLQQKLLNVSSKFKQLFNKKDEDVQKAEQTT
ncbi:ABC-type multidrug transport system fused ATPase/permease subunit [Alkalibacillus filiformis]|uniref:ABC-type multidrug transport system fused ATPase/permease subunit n=1 Tax=Alkalibacillus filiformis TaxID=200990 RepID=A0ABU0DSZ1_9BACI|nr:hypothetical protein [Alkalibacillus filiformis]MDQ0351470.1 ABC-type multidrug transport system fused ATPase/permease subunit [Alkalibacillus filiformis]